jgi:hypothetical protein
MTRWLHHPLWTHLPAALMIVGSVVVLLAAGPWPDKVPVHFGAGGRPNRWGSPWELAIFLVLLPAALMAGSAVLDEMWARYESRKSFNWMALVDECMVSFSAGFAVGYALSLPSFKDLWTVALEFWAIFGVAGVAAAAVLEWLRPWRPAPLSIQTEDTGSIESQIAEYSRTGRAWTYWETQNPLYLSVLVVLTCVWLAASTVVAWNQVPWLVPLLVLSITLMLACYGGLRVSANPARIEVRLGVLGLRLLRVRVEDVVKAAVHEFSPLGDYGGWGIRYGRGGWAFFFRGRRGVRITTSAGKRYLIGSDHPDRLAAVIRAAGAASGAPLGINL